MRRILSLAVIVASLPGCGYTFKATAPYGIKTVYVETFRNETYEPAVEIELTNGIIERFLFDGTLRVAEREKADAVLKGKLTRWIREPLRITSQEEVSEYRLVLMTEFSLWDNRTGTVLWEEKRFVGDTSFSTTGPFEKSEEKAREKAIQELARRIVDRTVEAWPE